MSTLNRRTRRLEQRNWVWRRYTECRNAREIDAAFEQLISAKADAFITGTDPIVLDRREQIVSFAYRHKLPAVCFVRQFAAVGGLLSYGPSISWMYRQAGEYVGKS